MSFHHVGIHVADMEESRKFYLEALKPLGYKVIISLLDGKVLGLGGFCGPDFWLSSPDAPTADGSDVRRNMESEGDHGLAAHPPRGTTGHLHIAFGASNREQVRKFHAAAIAAGGKCNGPPGLRPEYFSTYYGAFVLDPEGRNVEAVCTKPGFWAEPWGFVGWSVTVALLSGAGSGVAKWMGLF